jgi:hypothetical protein
MRGFADQRETHRFIAREKIMSKTQRSPGAMLRVLLCAALLLTPVPRATATPVEYDILFALIIVVCLPALEAVDLPSGSAVVIDQLTTAIEGARAANIVGNTSAELSRLSKALGAVQALMGMTSSCSDCADARAALQQVIGQAALLKTRIIGASGSCNPNGIVQPNEQCDPLAIPSGCAISLTTVTYCSDECRCESTIAP